MPEPSARIHAFDWLRGVAVLVMIQTHSLVLLKPEIHTQALFTWLVRIDGLVAPSFIFSAGFALALVQVRAGLTGRLGAGRKSFKRALEVLGVASLINLIWFPLLRQPKWLFRIDILHCIALSLLLALPLLIALSKRPQLLRWLMLTLALVIFSIAPFFENTTGLASLVLNTQPGVLDDTTAASFPLLPWAGYVFLGASFGTTVAMMKREAELWRWLGLLIGLGALLWWQQAAIKALYPAHNFWVTSPANAAQRWTLVLLVVCAFRALEIRWPAQVQRPALRWLADVGASSLSAYFFHEMLLFQQHVGLYSRFFAGRAEWPMFWLLLGTLIAATWACVRGWQRLTSWAKSLRPAS